MSDHIPFDLQVEIIKRLPTKSLLQFRGVSKAWKSLIGSAKFIADYNPQSQNLLIRTKDLRKDGLGLEYKYFKIIDDDTFPQHKFSLTFPPLCDANMFRDVIGYSRGLFCLLCCYPGTHELDYVASIWNPSIKKSVDIVVSNLLDRSFIGFGVCRDTNEPKIVKINRLGVNFCSYEVEVFTLRSRVWREPLSKFPNKWFENRWGKKPVVINGVIYWFSFDEWLIESHEGFSYMIISFDLTSEEFNQVYLPDKLAFDNGDRFLCDSPIYKLRESLAVVKCDFKASKEVYKVWIMDNTHNSVSKSFTKIFTINLPYVSLRTILGFRNNGELIMTMRDDDDDHHHDSLLLVACEPGSERMNRIGISGKYYGSLFVSSYKESLLLLDQPNMYIK